MKMESNKVVAWAALAPVRVRKCTKQTVGLYRPDLSKINLKMFCVVLYEISLVAVYINFTMKVRHFIWLNIWLLRQNHLKVKDVCLI